MPVPSPTRPAIPRRLHKDAVFDHLVAAILDGTLQPGERLRDADCEAWLGVSRTPIRVAVAKLGHVGLVDSTTHRAACVVVPCRAAAIDLLGAACALLCAVATSTLPGRDDEERAEIDRRLGVLAGACATASRSPRAPVDEIVDAARAVWTTLTARARDGLAVRFAERVALPLRHHLRDVSTADLGIVADVTDEVRRWFALEPDGEGRALEDVLARGLRRLGPGDPVGVGSTVGVGRGPVPGRPGSAVGARHGTQAPLVRRRLSDDVHDLVLAAVLDGTLAPDERLVDDELIAWLGVSRTPIRSALERLDEAGLVDLAPNRHTRVTRPRPADVVGARDLYAALVSWSADRVEAPSAGRGDELVAMLVRLDPIMRRAEGRTSTLATLSCVRPLLRRLASAEESPSLARELDLLEPRLAHGLVACGFSLPRGAWRSFSSAVTASIREAGGGLGPVAADLVRSLSDSPD
ncbi:GntR family transcriptional regulator [Frigoribacterium sp. PhB24]|uniref:GntR family transcriptional regulator n=1 Tax=Frigoribacterium sp. PhB24 TaxID=2485204 RepID=UPI000FB875CE|nr:GntR family transcriptional regulator [Frigoribacterium sp. PhB24]ROS49648.1 DNA-binding GntR family transcriptional regulator [Frigoribacterium sp. PhB24]